MLPEQPTRETAWIWTIRFPYRRAVARLSLTSDQYQPHEIEALAEILTEALKAKRVHVNEVRGNDRS